MNDKKNSRLTILLSINAAAVLIAGIAIASAIWLNGGIEFRMVGERSDIVKADNDELMLTLIDAKTGEYTEASSNNNYAGYTYAAQESYEFSSSTVPNGEIWNETAITIYATADVDICIGGGLSNLGEMYWQTSDPSVIGGFYDTARTWLGYNNENCRYPLIKGTGTTVITAGTYDGKRKDAIAVTVVEPPVEQWKREVLSLVNNIRANNGLGQLSWGTTCERAASIRANEIKARYSHYRPDGTDWTTVCPAPDENGISGENLAVGNAAVSPVTVVMLWMGSESHKDNILNPEFTRLAVGFAFDLDTKYKTHWSQIFSTY